VLYEIELPLASVLAKMEITGILIDAHKLKVLKTTTQQKIHEIKSEMEKLIGQDVNINSTAQLGIILYERFDLPTKGIKKTISGFSTDITSINKLEENLAEKNELTASEIDGYNFIRLLKQYRTYSKLNSTYLEGLEKHIMHDSRIHTIFHQLLAETGRLSSTEPNIQNIPIRSEEGREIRKLFIPAASNSLMAYDYSQIELRVMAHICQDPTLITAFKNGDDIHRITAQNILNKNPVTDQERSRAKAINFGIIYGISEYGLAKQVGISNHEAKDFIDKYFSVFPGIKDYMEKTEEQAAKDKFVKTIYGRTRQITGFDGNYRDYENAKRMAINTPIQGAAADIIKIAMINVDKAMVEANLQSKMLLQIHDELLFEIIPGEEAKMETLVKKAMESVLEMNVPLTVEGGFGKD